MKTQQIDFVRGRGAATNRTSRFDDWERSPDDERGAADAAQETKTGWRTITTEETARRIISRNQSPDIPFDQSINPYRGCEHGCSYCFARPTHTYLGLSAGLDFETKLFAKTNAGERLRRELSRVGYKPSVIALGTNTDPYQPIERELKITRGILEILEEHDHPVAITTKSALVTRDADVLARMSQKGLARVFVSVTTLDGALARKMEPRANAPFKRLEAIKILADAGIPTGVMVAPVIPALNDFEIERILEKAADAGAEAAGYVMLRLPLEVRDLFVEWLAVHYPDKQRHVLSLIEQVRDGNLNDSTFGQRMRGTGILAELIQKRFSMACRRLALNTHRRQLRTDLFHQVQEKTQLSLF
ncbi:PA0069 family radical SAM protein [Burkholderia humptydooensis]|uniref:PA0069 family radical SAM protein n=1 Tax=Burkholderia humptydooensis TaxID=430531 RepID=A0A7U4P775_9BURK|nr:PA0069 family radical SAM protein [Burkholderia humptydooensis]ALX44255.1 DNA repair photolyase [Burkholderia humptydooensis]QPS45605.1 PA0069 family radical SAM protein [Burkholderia humptydooensis]